MEEVKKQGMESLFVPYEIALALKELGFDKPCLMYYDYSWTLVESGVYECKAPLYQQAFRWFREKYGLNKSILLGYDYSIENESKHWFSGTTEECAYKTYEEAELACLIKLIEIVKTK